MKQIFVIPSWYPSKDDPVSGIFVKKQAEAFCQYSAQYMPIVGLWGQCDENIPLNHPKRIPSWLRDYTRRPQGQWTTENGVEVVSDRVISWSHRLPFGGAARLLAVTRRNIQRAIQRFGQIDLLHAYVSYPAGFVASQMSREFGIPYVITEFMGPFPFLAHQQKNGEPRTEIRQAIQGSACTIVLSEYLRCRFSELLLPEPTVIPFSVDHSRFSPQTRTPDGIVRMVCCCRLVAEKGVFELIMSFSHALETHRTLRLTLIGSGPDETALRAHARQFGVYELIDWKGQLENDAVADIMAGSDFFVLPSHFDTFGVVYIEAMACGLPIIATRCGGPDGFIHEAQGILVEVKNTAQLTAAMCQMVEDYANYDRHGIRAYSEGCFADAMVVDSVSKVYDRVLNMGSSVRQLKDNRHEIKARNF